MRTANNVYHIPFPYGLSSLLWRQREPVAESGDWHCASPELSRRVGNAYSSSRQRQLLRRWTKNNELLLLSSFIRTTGHAHLPYYVLYCTLKEAVAGQPLNEAHTRLDRFIGHPKQIALVQYRLVLALGNRASFLSTSVGSWFESRAFFSVCSVCCLFDCFVFSSR